MENKRKDIRKEMISMQLKDTVKLMDSKDYKERFKAEYWQTRIRKDKLELMLSKYYADTLDFEPTVPIDLLVAQLEHMENYLSVLMDRAGYEKIELFD